MFFPHTVAGWLVVWKGGWVDDFVVVRVNNGVDIRHTAVAQLDVIFIEYFVKFVLFWEVFLDESEKEFADVRYQVFVVWRVEPDDFPFSVSVCGLLLLLYFLELQLVVVPRSL